jgi:hypothetical protein
MMYWTSLFVAFLARYKVFCEGLGLSEVWIWEVMVRGRYWLCISRVSLWREVIISTGRRMVRYYVWSAPNSLVKRVVTECKPLMEWSGHSTEPAGVRACRSDIGDNGGHGLRAKARLKSRGQDGSGNVMYTNSLE